MSGYEYGLDENPKDRSLGGLVISVHKKQKLNDIWYTNFTVMTNKKILFNCTCTDFCWVMSGDKILAKGKAWVKNGKYQMQIEGIPLIQTESSESNTLSTLVSILGHKSIHSVNEARQIYNSIREYGSAHPFYSRYENDYDKVNMYLCYASNQLNKAGSEFGPKLMEPLLKNIDEDRAKSLLKNWYNQVERRKLLMLGLFDKEIRDSNYNTELLYRKIRNNPHTIPFLSEERCHNLCVRMNIVIEPEDIYCGKICRYIYNTCQKYNHMCLPYNKVKFMFSDLDNYLNKITDNTDPIASYDIVFDMNHLYIRPNHEDECLVSEVFTNICQDPNYVPFSDPVFVLPTLTDVQKTAIRGCLSHPISVITGSGGSGKTTCINEIVNNLTIAEIGFLICSFTGKAVSYIKSALAKNIIIQNSCYTLHRAIYKGVEYKVDYVIIDEATMVTTNLLAFFLRNFPDLKSILLVGDCNQLLPIGSGCVFTEVMNSRRFPVYQLSKAHRLLGGETDNNGIYQNSNRIANLPEGFTFNFEVFENFNTFPGNMETLYELFRRMYRGGISDHMITILCPRLEEAKEINEYISVFCRNENLSIEDNKGRIWRMEDRVMMTVNNYDIDIMNGEEGRITGFEDGKIQVTFSKEALETKKAIPKEKTFGFSLTEPDIKHHGNKPHTGMLIKSNCMTVHKSQASEWHFVCLFIPPNMERASAHFLNRNMIYTAITRPKFHLALIGNIDTATAAAVTKAAKRYENTGERLKLKLAECNDGIDARVLTMGVFDENEPDIEDEYDYYDFM